MSKNKYKYIECVYIVLTVCIVCVTMSHKDKTREGNRMKRTQNEYWYSLTAQIIQGQQAELEEVMLDQISEWTGRENNTLDDLTVGEIIGWLIDCQDEITATSLIK